MPDLAEELHLGRVERVVFGELELGGEDTAFKGRAFGPLDQRLPREEIVFVHRTRSDAVGRRGEEGFVFGKEAFRRHARGHTFVGVGTQGVRDRGQSWGVGRSVPGEGLS